MSVTVTDNLTARTAVLGQIASDTREALGRIERRLDRMDDRVDALAREHHADHVRVNERIDHLGERINGRIDSSTRWLITLGLGGFAALLGAMAHGFHWV